MPGFWQQITVGRHQFSRPPIRSYHFWVETLFLLMVAGIAAFLAVFFRLQLSATTIICMGLPILMLAVLWFGVLQVHQIVYAVYGSKWNFQKSESGDGERVDMLLDKLAYLSYTGFNYAASSVALAYGALVPSITMVHRAGITHV
jgi:hypothetical protein